MTKIILFNSIFLKTILAFSFSLMFSSYQVVGQPITKLANQYLSLGDSLLQEQLIEKSTVNYIKGLKLYQEIKDWKKVANVIVKVADNYFLERKANAALDFLEKELSNITSQSRVNDSLLAPIHHKVGVAFFWKKDFKNAIINYQKALNIRERSFIRNHPDIIRGYSNIAVSYTHLTLPTTPYV